MRRRIRQPAVPQHVTLPLEERELLDESDAVVRSKLPFDAAGPD